MDKDVVTDCHTGREETTRIPVSDDKPAEISVTYRNIYPQIDPKTGENRVFRLAESLDPSTTFPTTVKFTETSTHRYTVQLIMEEW